LPLIRSVIFSVLVVKMFNVQCQFSVFYSLGTRAASSATPATRVSTRVIVAKALIRKFTALLATPSALDPKDTVLDRERAASRAKNMSTGNKHFLVSFTCWLIVSEVYVPSLIETFLSETTTKLIRHVECSMFHCLTFPTFF
jgi:hypothetical protein